MTSGRHAASLVAPILLGATRVALGVLWIMEGTLKYRAHFGAADILLVAEGAQQNTRVPDYFRAFASVAMERWPDLFGFGIPLWETTMGIALVVGVVTLPAALGSILTLMMYWSSDQLIAQYPVMAVLSVLVVAFPLTASRGSLTTLLEVVARRSRFTPIPLAARRWL